MKKILLSLSVVSFLCAGNFGDFDKFDDDFDRFMNGPKKTKENKQEQKATEKEEKADDKKSEKDSKKDKEADAKNLTKSFDRGFYDYDYSTKVYADIEYRFDSNGNVSSIAYPFSAKKMTMSEVEYKKFALRQIYSAVQGTLRNNGELITLKTLISATNKAGANKAMDNLKTQLGNVLPLLDNYNVIEVVDENYNDENGTYNIKVKVADDIINQAKAQAK